MQTNIIKSIRDIIHFIVATNTKTDTATPTLADDIFMSAGKKKTEPDAVDLLTIPMQLKLQNQKWTANIALSIEK